MGNRISRTDFENIHKIAKENPSISDREMARQLGIGRDAVAKWRKRNEYPEQENRTITPLSTRIHEWLRTHKREVSIDEISDRFDVAVGKVRAAISELKSSKKNIAHISDARVSADVILPASKPTRIDISKFKGKSVKFGLCSDEHLGSKYHRDDVREALFDIWESQGIKTIYSCGNMIDGEARFNKHDLIVHGMQNQVDYYIEHWPRRKGMTTHFVTGDDHEGWYVQREGVNIGEFIQMCAENSERNDLRFLGHMEHDVIIAAPKGECSIRLIHAGGGSAYATSYSVQKIAESLTGGMKPDVMLVGHYHKAEYSYVRNIHIVQAGTLEDQTPFMRKLKIQAHIGGWTISFDVDDFGNVHAFTPQFHPFYDREFYEQNWQYLWKPKKTQKT